MERKKTSESLQNMKKVHWFLVDPYGEPSWVCSGQKTHLLQRLNKRLNQQLITGEKMIPCSVALNSKMQSFS